MYYTRLNRLNQDKRQQIPCILTILRETPCAFAKSAYTDAKHPEITDGFRDVVLQFFQMDNAINSADFITKGLMVGSTFGF